MVWKNGLIGMMVTEGEREKRVTQNHLQRRTKSINPRQVTETGAIPFRMWGFEALNSMGWDRDDQETRLSPPSGRAEAEGMDQWKRCISTVTWSELLLQRPMPRLCECLLGGTEGHCVPVTMNKSM